MEPRLLIIGCIAFLCFFQGMLGQSEQEEMMVDSPGLYYLCRDGSEPLGYCGGFVPQPCTAGQGCQRVPRTDFGVCCLNVSSGIRQKCWDGRKPAGLCLGYADERCMPWQHCEPVRRTDFGYCCENRHRCRNGGFSRGPCLGFFNIRCGPGMRCERNPGSSGGECCPRRRGTTTETGRALGPQCPQFVERPCRKQHECHWDNQCQSLFDMKCCMTPCGRRCLDPFFGI